MDRTPKNPRLERLLAEQDLRRRLPALLESPRSDDARLDLADTLEVLGCDLPARALRAGGTLVIREGCLWVLRGDPCRPTPHMLGDVPAVEWPGCDCCGELADAMDEINGAWWCCECIRREIPW